MFKVPKYFNSRQDAKEWLINKGFRERRLNDPKIFGSHIKETQKGWWEARIFESNYHMRLEGVLVENIYKIDLHLYIA